MTGQDWLEKDFYSVLGVPKDADAATIKKAYRKLARQMHPDHNPGDAKAEARFKEVGEAYAVLSDTEQRGQYDQLRAMAGGGARFTSPGGPAAARGSRTSSAACSAAASARWRGGRVRYTNAPGGAAGFEDLLGGLFGNGGGGGFSTAPAAGRRPDRPAPPSRSGRPSTGSTVSLNVEGRTVNARIPAGVRDGQKIRLRGKGRPGDRGGPAGDLVVTVRVTPHPVFSLDGDNLRITVPVAFDEAALGATIEVPTLDGATVRVKVPEGTPSGRTLRVKGKGVTTATARATCWSPCRSSSRSGSPARRVRPSRRSASRRPARTCAPTCSTRAKT